VEVRRLTFNCLNDRFAANIKRFPVFYPEGGFPMPSYKYDHVHLVSAAPEKTAEFYTKTFGATVGKTMNFPGGMTLIPLDLNGSRILVSNTRTQPPVYGLEHFGLTTDNIEESVKELKAKGVKFQMEVTRLAPGVKVAFLWAPENVLVELVEAKS
jgi:catechol 2,3-dioxygenase-like lactoylglutathione lyase family enzyme